MLYQLIAYYTIDKGIDKSLWDYLSATVIIFQNAALLEVSSTISLLLKLIYILTDDPWTDDFG